MASSIKQLISINRNTQDKLPIMGICVYLSCIPSIGFLNFSHGQWTTHTTQKYQVPNLLILSYFLETPKALQASISKTVTVGALDFKYCHTIYRYSMPWYCVKRQHSFKINCAVLNKHATLNQLITHQLQNMIVTTKLCNVQLSTKTIAEQEVLSGKCNLLEQP